MVVEWLKVSVPKQKRDRYLQVDAEIWSATLSKYPGYIKKEIWLDPNREDDLIMVIYWESKEAWKSVPADVLEETDRRFTEAMGESFPFLEEREFFVI